MHESTAQRLRKGFEDLSFKDGGSIDAFGMCFTGLVNNLLTLGDTIDDKRIDKKVLRLVPKRYSEVAIDVETLLELNTFSLEELTCHLLIVQDRLVEVENAGGTWILLTEE